jgi:hypothetical protein
MSTDRDCGHVRDLAPEMALGIAEAEERAAALEHLLTCHECRAYLDELSSEVDDLLLLAPSIEPPSGFEARVAEAMTPPARKRAWARPLAFAGTALASAAVVVVAMLAIFHDDRELASDYRQTLADANGSYFSADELKAPGGRAVGNVFRYEGAPSFVMVSVSDKAGSLPDGVYDCQFVDAKGRSESFGKLELSGGEGSYGRAVSESLEEYRQVRLIGPGKGTVVEAALDSGQNS